MRAKRFVSAVSVLGALTASAMAQFSTGAGLAAPGGTADPNWMVTVPVALNLGTIQAVMLDHGPTSFPYTAYTPNDATSQWISFQADGGNSITGSPPASVGNYTYFTSINFGAGGTVSGHLWSDNAVLDVTVGATSFGTAPLSTVHGDGSTGWFLAGTAFSVNQVFTGVQSLEITIRNGVPGQTHNPDPTAFRAALNPVPEPFTVGLGLAALAAAGRRRLKARQA